MKTHPKTKHSPSQTEAKNLTFGELITATYQACEKQTAPKIIQLAVQSHLIRFPRV